MKIKGKVHCFFEQSGAFKREFIKMNIAAEDYDIQDNFGETNHMLDLFSEIEKGYNNEPSIWDNIEKDDLVIAFFPCIYFETVQMCYYQCSHNNNRHKPLIGRIDDAIERIEQRARYHILLYKMVRNVLSRNLRLIIENPATSPSFLIGMQNFPNPTFIDKNRMLRGDYFVKPTAYWFFNCEPTYGRSFQKDKVQKTILNAKQSEKAGICSTERSMISPDYARNFICDFILGKQQPHTEHELFE